MKKRQFSLITLMVSLFMILSCNTNEDENQSLNNANIETKSNFVVPTNVSNVTTLESIKENEITSIGAMEVQKGAELFFNHNEKELSVLSGFTAEGNYVFDMDGDKIVDVQIVPVSEGDFTSVYYLDENGEKICKAKMDTVENTTYITIVEVYNADSKFGQLSKKGRWRTCFEGVAGSAEGIAGAVICNFGGPWCLAGYYSGIALGCL